MKAYQIAGAVVGGLMTVGFTVPLLHEHEAEGPSPVASEAFTEAATASSLGTALGACCWDRESCCELNESECTESGGRFYEGQFCSADPCGYGACCLPAGGCMHGLETACDEYCGVFMGPETDCDPDPCEHGACCYDGVDGGECRILRPDYCSDFLGGSFQGSSTSCADRICTGACCVSSASCIENVTDRTCTEYLQGAFLGASATCADNAVCKDTTGACCIPDHRGFGALALIPELWPGIPAAPPCPYGPPSAPCEPDCCPGSITGAFCVHVTEFECSAYGDFGAVYRGDGSTCSPGDCALIGPTIDMRAPRVEDDDVHMGPSGVDSLHLLWSERILFADSDLTIINEGGQPIPFSVSGTHTQLMTIVFDEVLLNDKYTVIISDSVVSAVTKRPIDGDNDGIAGGDAVLVMEHRNPFDQDRDSDVDLNDFALFQQQFTGPH